ncbi:Cyanovirin-N [Dichotomopilus funicola]|uniref:Cyanovirin-N n=1 Tax=Dichotomopilus funicola TaxID=1934379 RepID=A0AAN6UV46_9PEZI|nr:Cyanovirin-N [Dichotomopilus funicola]
MSFSGTAQNIRVDDGHLLRADLQSVDDEWKYAELDLNTVIGNNEGKFEWEGVDFAGSASQISFSLEGDDNVPVLRALLKDSGDVDHPADINLSERIENVDGEFVFKWNAI